MAKYRDDYALNDYTKVPNGLILKELQLIRSQLTQLNKFLSNRDEAVDDDSESDESSDNDDMLEEPKPKKLKIKKVTENSDFKCEPQSEVINKQAQFSAKAAFMKHSSKVEFKKAFKIETSTCIMQNAANVPPKPWFKCGLCGTSYAARYATKQHLLKHHNIPSKEDKGYYDSFIEVIEGL